jgi:hypothetical protein
MSRSINVLSAHLYVEVFLPATISCITRPRRTSCQGLTNAPQPPPRPSHPPVPPRRWIAHLDMDAFYASVELLRYPELRGQPVVIGGGRRHQPVMQADGTRRFATLAGYAGRGVITTATYAARDLGVHSGMGLMKAAALAPQACCCRWTLTSTGVIHACSRPPWPRWRR